MPENSGGTVYVVDTNSFRVMGNYYPETFPTFWGHLGTLAESGRLVSVREVLKELEEQNTIAKSSLGCPLVPASSRRPRRQK